MNCPNCEASGSFYANRENTPETTVEMYGCPDPDCPVGVFTAVVDR